MANDLFDTAGNASGTQKCGTVVVNAQGPVGAVHKTLDNGFEVDIATYTAEWDDRFDSIRLYTGDADT